MSSSAKPIKVYVNVLVAFDQNGRMFPRSIEWEDGHIYPVDRVLDVRQSNAARAGGQGDRYSIRVNDHETLLFFEHNTDFASAVAGRWFVERREA